MRHQLSSWGPRLLVGGALLVNLALALALGGRWRWLLVAVTALLLVLDLVLHDGRPNHPPPDDTEPGEEQTQGRD